jgi:hypothetical protein
MAIESRNNGFLLSVPWDCARGIKEPFNGCGVIVLCRNLVLGTVVRVRPR